MAPGRTANFAGWAETLADHPEATEPVLDAFYRADKARTPGAAR